jgi:hypothetical protein
MIPGMLVELGQDAQAADANGAVGGEVEPVQAHGLL